MPLRAHAAHAAHDLVASAWIGILAHGRQLGEIRVVADHDKRRAAHGIAIQL